MVQTTATAEDCSSLPNLLARQMMNAATPESQQLKSRSIPAALLTMDMVPELFADQVCVKNTFIDQVSQLSPTLLSFYRERNVSTCPSKKVGRLISFSESPLLPPSTPSDEEMVKTPLLSPCGFDDTPPMEMRCSQMSSSSVWNVVKKDLFGTAGGMPPQLPTTTGPAILHTDKIIATHVRDFSDRHFLSLASVIVKDQQHQPQPLTAISKSCGPDASDRLPPRAVPPPPGPPPPPQHSPRMTTSTNSLLTGGGGVAATQQTAAIQRSSAAICGLLLAPPSSGGGGGGNSSSLMVPPPPPCHSPKVLKSIGSKDHPGRCKPCAFLHTRGCGNGIMCQFCHACAPEEIKRRRKQRLEQRRLAKKLLEEGESS